MTSSQFFDERVLDLRACTTEEERDSALAALLIAFFQSSFDNRLGTWSGKHSQETLHQTCHALEALDGLDADASIGSMVRGGIQWLQQDAPACVTSIVRRSYDSMGSAAS